MIIDLRGIEPGDRSAREKQPKEIDAGFGQLVQRKIAARDLGKDRQEPGPGRRLEDRGVICAAASAASPMGKGVLNC